MPVTTIKQPSECVINKAVLNVSNSLNFWRRNYFFILAHLYINVNNTATKQVRIMEQNCILKREKKESIYHV